TRVVARYLGVATDAIFHDAQRTEFVDDDLLAIQTVAPLPVDHRARRAEPHSQGNTSEQGRQQQQRRAGDDNVAQALGDAAHAEERRFAHCDDWNAVDQVEARLYQVEHAQVGHEIDGSRRVAQ